GFPAAEPAVPAFADPAVAPATGAALSAGWPGCPAPAPTALAPAEPDAGPEPDVVPVADVLPDPAPLPWPPIRLNATPLAPSTSRAEPAASPTHAPHRCCSPYDRAPTDPPARSDGP